MHTNFCLAGKTLEVGQGLFLNVNTVDKPTAKLLSAAVFSWLRAAFVFSIAY